MGRVRICIVAVMVVQVILLLRNMGTNNNNNKYESTGQVHLLILSTWRSGSSLVGQFFSQHPDVFYLKEPAWNVWKSGFHNSAHVLRRLVRDMVQSIFRCDMSVFDAYMHKTNIVSDLFQWSFSRALCSPPACKSFSRKDVLTSGQCKKKCGTDPFARIQDACKTYSHIVIQEVRIFDVKDLFSLLKNPNLNLKILHVVRDPRALASSRVQTKSALKLDNDIILNTDTSKDHDSEHRILQKICQSQVDIYKTVNSKNLLFFPKDRYMLLRYDDLVREPLRKARDMFSFANLDLTTNLSKWIYKMTHGKQRKRNNFEVIPRDALKVSQAWREGLSFQKVKQVQDVCREAMEVFRYQFIDTVKELRNLSVVSMFPREREDFIWSSRKDNEQIYGLKKKDTK